MSKAQTKKMLMLVGIAAIAYFIWMKYQKRG